MQTTMCMRWLRACLMAPRRVRASAVPITVAKKYRRQDNGLKEQAGFGPKVILLSLTGAIPTRRKHDTDTTRQMQKDHQDNAPKPGLCAKTDARRGRAAGIPYAGGRPAT